MDLIELLNNPFKGKLKHKEINNFKVAKLLIEMGYRFTYPNEIQHLNVDELGNWLEENDGAYTNEIWFEELTNDELGNKYSCIFDILAHTLGLTFQAIPTIYIGEPEGIEIDTGVTTTIECKDQQQYEYITWWCEQFGIEYEADGFSIGLKDFSEENEMSFLFLYENGEVIESCAIDWSSGYDNVSTDMASALAERDLEFKFSSYSSSEYSSKIMTNVRETISRTKEVVF